jgi:hypothetical protein
MSERDRQLEREADLSRDGDVGLGAETGAGGDLENVTGREESRGRAETGAGAGAGGLRSRLGERAETVATGRSLAAALVVVAASAVLVGGVLPLGSLGNLLGVALGSFLYGVAASTRRYTETAVAGTAVGGVLALLGNLALSLTGVGVPLIAVGAAGGGLAGLVGHYFGRDLRDGLTREI